MSPWPSVVTARARGRGPGPGLVPEYRVSEWVNDGTEGLSLPECVPTEVLVGAGKSTMVGVLTRSMLDDGRGAARSKVFKHGHEESTGRTSSIGQHNLCVRD